VDSQLLSSREQQTNMEDLTKSDETLADDAKVKNDLFNLVENLRIELQKKDEELKIKDEKLAKDKQEKKVCNAFYYFQNLYMNKSFCSEIISRFGAGKSYE
jgi:hypothetical protein